MESIPDIARIVQVNEKIPERKILNYDGSHLGEHDFMVAISWYYPCTKVTSGMKSIVLYAILNLPNLFGPQYVILKRNCAKQTDQLIIDELKPIFGLHKMGSHSIRLRGIPRKKDIKHPWLIDQSGHEYANVFIHPQWSEYIVFRATTMNGAFMPLPTLESVQWIPNNNSEITEGHKKFFFEIQKIIVYRELLRVGSTKLNDILIKSIDNKIVPMSIDEMVIRPSNNTRKRMTQELEKFFFPKTTTKTEVIIKMLGLTKDNYCSQIEMIRNSVSKIITRVDQDKLRLADDIINQLIDRCTIYYEMIENS